VKVDVRLIICEEESGSNSVSVQAKGVCFLILTYVSTHFTSYLVIPSVGLAIDSIT
jgi:hypothetical protein